MTFLWLQQQVMSSSERLFHLGWIIREQRRNLERLVKSSINMDGMENDVNGTQSFDTSVAAGLCCFSSSALDTNHVNFIQSYKRLASKDCLVSNLLCNLRKKPKILAECLSLASTASNVTNNQQSSTLNNVIQVIVSSLYGDCLVSEDRIYTLVLLKELMDLQIIPNDNPRRILRHGSSAFSKVYKMLIENLSSARLFLMVALKDAVISVLAEDDLYLEMDPAKAIIRFSPEERLRHFGRETDNKSEYNEKLNNYRHYVMEKLSVLVMKFIDGIRSNFFSFPLDVIWIVKQLASGLKRKQGPESDDMEINAICADLIFNHLICHAVINPELVGIIDMHITTIARFQPDANRPNTSCPDHGSL